MKKQALFVEANKLKLLSKYDEAIAIYDRLLKEDPLNATIHHDLARIYMAKEDFDKAKDHGSKAVRYEPGEKWYLMTYGEICEWAQDYKDAAESFGKLAHLTGDIRLYKRCADNLALAGDLKAAIAAYTELEERFGKVPDMILSKVDIWISLGEDGNAEKELKELINSQPEDVFLRLELADFYAARGYGKKALKAYKEVLEREPSNEFVLLAIRKLEEGEDGQSETKRISALIADERISLDHKITVLIPLLNRLTQSGDVSITSELLLWTGMLVHDYPGEAKSHAIRGDVLALSERTDEAIEAYKRTLSLDKSVYVVWEQLMFLLLEERQFANLNAIAEEALDYYPNQAGPYYFLGMSALSEGNITAARRMADEAHFVGGPGGTLSGPTTVLRSRIMEAEGDTEKAWDIIRNYIEESEVKDPSVYEFAGDLLLKKGLKSQADSMWKRAIEMGGNRDRLTQKIQST